MTQQNLRYWVGPPAPLAGGTEFAEPPSVPELAMKDLIDQLKAVFDEFPNLPPGNICNSDETGLQPLP
eukprot:jgi/Tetstr1/434637/TSEL_023728.t1